MLLCWFFGASVGAQMFWKNEILLKGASSFYPPNLQQPLVNRQGDVAYSARLPGGYQDVYVNSTNVSSLALGNGSHGAWASMINNSGQVTWQGYGQQGGVRVFVDQEDWSTKVLGPNDKRQISADGMDDKGIPVFLAEHTTAGGVDAIYHGYQNLSANLVASDHLGNYGGLVNGQGDVAWRAGGTAEFGYGYRIFKNDQPLSDLVYGGPQWSATSLLKVNSKGQVGWSGWMGNGNHVFIDTFDYSADYFHGKVHDSGIIGLNSKGDTFWAALYDGKSVLFLDHNILATEDANNTSFSVYFLSENGVAVWQAKLPDGLWHLFKNTTPLDTSLLGAHPQIYPGGIDDEGHVLWQGKGDAMGPNAHMFVDNFDLSASVFPDHENWHAVPMAMGANGHVLWAAYDVRTGLYDIYRSTPVPEPSAVVPVALFACSGWMWRSVGKCSRRRS